MRSGLKTLTNRDPHGWAELLPARTSRPCLVGEKRAAWTVIGAGVTGLSAARRLAELHPSEEVLLLDARTVGEGASSRNSGFAVAVSHFSGPFEPSAVDNMRRVNRINQAGVALLREMVQANSIDCQWREDGFYHVAADASSERECAHFLDYLQRMDLPHTAKSADELETELGTAHYRQAVHVPLGALVQPAALVRGLADTPPANVTLFEESPVLKIEHGAPLRLSLSEGEVVTDNLLICGNYEAPKLGFLRNRIAASTLSGSFTSILTPEERASLGTVSDWGLLSLHGGGATIRLTVDGRISIRNTAEYLGGKLMDDGLLAKRQDLHRASFDARFPQLAHVPFEFAWSGVEGGTANGTNFFGRQDHNIFLAGGYNGSGVSRGTAFGFALAEYASGADSALISDCLASPAASWIPPRPFLDIAAAFKMRARFLGVGQDR